jgi:hypothetical protein
VVPDNLSSFQLDHTVWHPSRLPFATFTFFELFDIFIFIRFVVVPDISQCALRFISEDGMLVNLESLFDSLGSRAVLWPRSIVSNPIPSNGTVNIYVGEFLGKIWKVQLHLDSGNELVPRWGILYYYMYYYMIVIYMVLYVSILSLNNARAITHVYTGLVFRRYCLIDPISQLQQLCVNLSTQGHSFKRTERQFSPRYWTSASS